MKKFWHSGQQESRSEEGMESAKYTTKYTTALQSDGQVNLAFENEQGVRRTSHLEAIEEEQSDLSFHSETEAELNGFKFSPRLDQVEPGDNTDSKDEYDEFDEMEDYNIMDPPRLKMSREKLLPYLLDRLQHVEDVCTDPDCPYNRWLYSKEEFPSDQCLLDWEDTPNQQSLLTQSIGYNNPSSLESTRIPQNNSTLTASDTSKQSCGPPPYTTGNYRANYPIITLPKSARKKRHSKSPIDGISDVKLPLPEAVSLSGCSCETSSVTSSCSTCIVEPEDPTAPHAFVVQDGAKKRGGGNQCLPDCDISCCASLSFMSFCVVGLVALLLYLYFNTNAMKKGMTIS